MIDPVLVANLMPYSLQIASVALLAAILPLVLRLDAARVRYLYWRAIVTLCLLLPWLQRAPAASTQMPTPEAPAGSIATSTQLVAAAAAATTDWSAIIGLSIAIGIGLRLLWIAVGLIQLRSWRGRGEPLPATEHEQLQQLIGTRADLRYVDGTRQPVTFGVWRPLVLLPDRLRRYAPEIREAVVAHELVHVKRRDWAWVLVEELIRAGLWFHPAIWWLLSRVQLAREEVVDATAIAITGRRRSYVEALLTFADATPLSPAPAFAWRRHLFRRILLLSREDVMSAKRLVGSCLVVMMVIAGGTWYVAGAFPMTEGSVVQHALADPGPLERAANPVTPENPIPRRVHAETASATLNVADDRGVARVIVKVTLDHAGRVAEARVSGVSMSASGMSFNFRNATMADLYNFLDRATVRRAPGAPAEPLGPTARPVIDPLMASAVAAARLWQFDPPFNPPIAFEIVFAFAAGRSATHNVVTIPPPPPPPAPGTPALGTGIDDTGALRIGGAVRPPTKVKDVRPVYPAEAREAKVQGVVILEVRIEADGRVGDARVLRSVPMLDQAALDAVRQWEFTPVLLNGVATPVVMTVTVQFALQ